ncbi:MAG: sulfatase-like hydrolase/transferase, partial [bacterium]
MKNFISLLRESVTVIFFMALTLAGWETALAAGSMPHMLSSFGSWAGFTVYSLGGFMILSAIFLIPGFIVGLITGLFKRNWDRPSIRRFLLAAALGTSFIVIVVLLKPSLVFTSTSGLRGFKGVLLAGGLVVISYLVGIAISYGTFQIFEMKNARGQWSFMVGFWLFLVSVPPIAALIWSSPLGEFLLKFVIFIAIAAVGLFIAFLAVPKLYDVLNKGSSIRRWIPLAVLIIIYLIALPRPAKVSKGEPADSDHPPIVLLTIDTLRPDALDCYPTGITYRLGTPNIKRLADEGALFENAYSTAPWTISSVASFLSGLPPTAHGATNSKNSMTQGATTLAEILKESGYTTGAFVVNGLLSPATGVNQGFDSYEEVTSILRDSRKLLFQKLYDRIKLTMPEPAMPNFNPVMENYATGRAVKFIQDHKGERFFLWLHLLAPHGTYYPPKEYRDRIEKELDITVPKKEIYTQAQLKFGTVPITPSVLNGILALYAGEVAFTDDNVGKVISALEDSNIFDKCLFVFSADHGEEFFEHDRQAHAHSLYPELLHVPL